MAITIGSEETGSFLSVVVIAIWRLRLDRETTVGQAVVGVLYGAWLIVGPILDSFFRCPTRTAVLPTAFSKRRSR